MKKYLFSFLVSLTFSSCVTNDRQKIEYLPISEFRNDTSIIQPGTRVKLLAFSGSKDNDKETIYYSQIIVINISTGDTLSILCPALKSPSVDGTADQMIVMPNEFDPGKGILEANYQRFDSTTIMSLQILTQVKGETSPQGGNFDKYLGGNIVMNQLVAINRTIPIFSKKYRTAIGTLSFDTNIQR